MKITLKAARVNAKYTLREAAEKLDTNKTALNYWENGKTFPTFVEKVKMSNLYNMPLANIIFPEG